MNDKLIKLPSGEEIEARLLQERMEKAQREINAICKKYRVRLQGRVEFFTGDVQIIPYVDEKDVT